MLEGGPDGVWEDEGLEPTRPKEETVEEVETGDDGLSQIVEEYRLVEELQGEQRT